MKIFDDIATAITDATTAFIQRANAQENALTLESGIRTTASLPFVFGNRAGMSFWTQPSFTPYNTLTELQTDVQAMLAKPLLCQWLALLCAERFALESFLVNLYKYDTTGFGHVVKLFDNMVSVVYFSALARIYVLTETLHVALRLSLTVASVGADAVDLVLDAIAAAIAPNESPCFN